jgi:hypothetical protein
VQHITKDSLLDGIQLFRVHTAAELLATVRMLPTMLGADPQVGCSLLSLPRLHSPQVSSQRHAPWRDAKCTPRQHVELAGVA